MAEQLAQRGILPDLMISSSAARALQTSRLLVQGLPYQGAIEVTRRLYLSEPAQYLELLSDVPDDKKCVALVGHNPTCSELLFHLSGESHDMPTSGTAVITLPLLRWADVSQPVRGHLVHFFRPKEK